MTTARDRNARVEVEQFLRELERELPLTLTVIQACKVLQCSRRTFARLMQSGQIRTVRSISAGSSPVIVPRSELIRFMASRAC